MTQRIVLVGIVAAATAISHPAVTRAQSDTAPPRPAVGAVTSGPALAPSRTALQNGVRLTTLPYGRTPKALIRVVIETGAEPEAQCGMTSVIAALLQSGGAVLSAARLTDTIAHMGGSLSAVARPERIELSLEVLTPYAVPAVELLGRVVSAPMLDSATVRAAEADLSHGGSRNRTDVSTVARTAFETALFPGGEFNARCASPADIDRYSAADVRAYYEARASTRRTVVYVVGRFDRGAVDRAVSRAFGAWRSSGAGEKTAASASTAGPKLVIVQRPGAKQVALVVGARVPGPAGADFVPMTVADAILGGSLISRITMNIREAKGYAYSPASELVSAPSGSAYWAEETNVAATVAWPALREILKEIQQLGVASPSDSELIGIRRYIAGKELVTRGTRDGRLEAIEAQDMAESRGQRGGDELAGMLAVTPGDVRRVVGEHLDPRGLTVVIAGDTTAMVDQMAELRAALGK